MELDFLGRGAAFNWQEGNTAAYHKEQDRVLLIDCGETVFGQLMSRYVLDGCRELYILISHLHTDHCGSLASLCFYCTYILKIKPVILLPEDHTYRNQIETLLSLTGVNLSSVILAHCSTFPGMDEIREIAYVRTEHVPGMQCYSFRLDGRDGSVFYSADTCSTDGLKRFLRTSQKIDKIYMEASSRDYPGNIHLPIGHLADIIPDDLRSRTRIMHLDSDACREMGEAMGFKTVSVHEISESCAD